MMKIFNVRDIFLTEHTLLVRGNEWYVKHVMDSWRYEFRNEKGDAMNWKSQARLNF